MFLTDDRSATGTYFEKETEPEIARTNRNSGDRVVVESLELSVRKYDGIRDRDVFLRSSSRPEIALSSDRKDTAPRISEICDLKTEWLFDFIFERARKLLQRLH